MTQAVTVVIPVWNRCDLLAVLLEKLAAQSLQPAEILVVDNGSSDGAPEFAESRGSRVIRMGHNAGFSAAVNRGIQECNSPLVAILNDDVEPAPNWLYELVHALSPEMWFATGRILSWSSPETIDATWDALCRGGCAWRVGHGRRDGTPFAAARVIESAPCTAALFRAELFHRAGLLNEVFESYLEDVEFGLRCAQLRCPGIYVPEAVSRHHGSATLGRWHPEVVRRIARNQILLLARHYPSQLLRRFAWTILVAQTLWGFVAFRHGCGLAWVRGVTAGLRLFRTARGKDMAESEDLAEILKRQEGTIYNVQRQVGFDWFWRVYFLLTAWKK